MSTKTLVAHDTRQDDNRIFKKQASSTLEMDRIR